MAVADGLAQGDDVGHRPLGLERPHVAARPAEAHLDLVGDAHAARLSDGGERLLQEAGGRHHLAAAAGQ